MAYYPNGRGTYGQPPPSSHPQQPYPMYHTQSQPYPSHHLQRSSSFDAGDDGASPDETRGGQHYGMARGQSYTTNHEQDRWTPGNGGYQPNYPLRNSSQSVGTQAYPNQYQSASPEPTRYNPQQYASAQQSPQPTQYGQIPPVPYRNGSGHQAYNPAAYHPAELQRQPMYDYAGFSNPYPNRQNSYSQPPPPPPRPRESYSAHQTPNIDAYSASSQSPTPQHPGSAPLPPRSGPYSQPAPLPPRHDSISARRLPYPNPFTSQSPLSEGYDPRFQTSAQEQTAPLTYNVSGDRSSSFANRVSRLSPQVSPEPLAPSPPASQTYNAFPHRTDTLTRHPQARPLPGPPSDSEEDTDYFGRLNGAHSTQPGASSDMNELMKEIEATISHGRPPRGQSSGVQAARHMGTSEPPDTPDPLFPSNRLSITPDERHTHTNGHLEATNAGLDINYGAFSEDSDAEAAAGLAAMQAAEEQEAAEEARRGGSGNTSRISTHGSQGQAFQQKTQSSDEQSSDSDYPFDMGLASGGYDALAPYDDHSTTGARLSMVDAVGSRVNSVRSSDRSTEGRGSRAESILPMPSPEFTRPLPPLRNIDIARVDTSGTGGLTEPSPHPRRLSFEDGDEAALLDNEGQNFEDGSPIKDSIPDLFYHPGMSPRRPLPPAPLESQPRIPNLVPAGTYQSLNRSDSYQTMTAPLTPEAFNVNSPTAVPRSTSLASTRSVPKLDQPMRAKTDSERNKMQRQSTLSPVSTYGSQMGIGFDLPTVPSMFIPEKITQAQYRKCSEPWALSSVVAWLKTIAASAEDLKEQALTEAVVLLFTQKVPTMNTTEAETLGAKVIKDMFKANVLIKEEEWVRFGSGNISGVLFQLTGSGCYSPRLHMADGAGKCYSHHCMRTWRRVDLSQHMPLERKTEDWATFYKLKKEDLEGRDKKEIERQNILHEIITTEDLFMQYLDVLRILYRDQLKTFQPAIIQPARLPAFIEEVFGPVDELKKVNEDYLLGQLKYRQQEQGPWITGFSDIFREWIRKAKIVYIAYSSGFPYANYLFRREAERNIAFRSFLDHARDDKRSNRLSWDTYLKVPITRLQRYGLLLQTVHKNMIGDSDEKLNLQYAIDEVRTVTFECNKQVDEMSKKIQLKELQSKLTFRKGIQGDLALHQDHHEILMQGDLLRASGKGFQWVDTRAILFDHYLVLAKIVSNRDAGGLKHERYDVSKTPIPMDLIVLESTNDDAVVKSSVKGIGTVTTAVAKPPVDPRGRGGSATAGPGTLTHINTSGSTNSQTTGSSAKSMVTTTVLSDSSSKDDRVMYPFRVRHLGKPEVYTLYSPSAANRQEWCEAIITAKTNHATSLFAQNAEPFKLKILADSAFAYDSLYSGATSVVIKGTPLDRAIKETEEHYIGQPRPGPVCRAAVNCATVFNQPYGRLMCAVGTDFGVYISEYSDPRGWSRTIQMSRVTQIAVFEEFNLFLLISDKSLIAYHLDAVCSPSGTSAPPNDSTRRAPQKLSSGRDVGFFTTGRMKDRALVFYKKKEGLSSKFKVLEPVLQKSSTSRSRFLPSSTRRGQTEFFREYDEFYIPAECYSINLFHSSLAISTSRGVEVLTLDKKQPWSVPNLRAEGPDAAAQAHLSSIATRIRDLKPLGMFRLGDQEFLVAFEDCAVYVNKHGDISRSVVMEFVGRARSACLFGQYLILFNDDFVEIRNSMNGRMKQVIAGRDIKCLDDGMGGWGNSSPATAALGGGLNGLGVQGFGAAPRSVKICMQHPEFERGQLVVELLENDVKQE